MFVFSKWLPTPHPKTKTRIFIIVEPNKSKFVAFKLHFGRYQIALVNIKESLDFVDVSTDFPRFPSD